MHTVLFDFPLPLFLGSFTWLEGAITAFVLLLLYFWRRRVPGFQASDVQFWILCYLGLRALAWYGGPGYVFKLHTYGVMIALGFVVGIYVAVRQARREGVAPDVILDLSFWILLSSLVGSRVLFIMVNFGDYLRDPLSLLKIWQGGLVFFGGLLGALVASYYFCLRRKLSFLRIADIMIPSVALGQAFGRLGCFAAGCCHGRPTGSAWFGAIFHESGTVVAHNSLLGEPLHPTQLYESLASLGIFFTLLWIRRRKHHHGEVLITYALLYPIVRFVNEFFRGDPERGMIAEIDLFGDSRPELLSTSQLVAIGLAAAALVALFAFRRKWALLADEVPKAPSEPSAD